MCPINKVDLNWFALSLGQNFVQLNDNIPYFELVLVYLDLDQHGIGKEQKKEKENIV